MLVYILQEVVLYCYTDVHDGQSHLRDWVSLVARASDQQSEKVGSNPPCALKKATLSYLLHLWTEMWMVVPSNKTDFVSDFLYLSFLFTFLHLYLSGCHNQYEIKENKCNKKKWTARIEPS